MESVNRFRRVFEEHGFYQERWFAGYCAVISHSNKDAKWCLWVIKDLDIVLASNADTEEEAHEWLRTAEKHLFLHLARAE